MHRSIIQGSCILFWPHSFCSGARPPCTEGICCFPARYLKYLGLTVCVRHYLTTESKVSVDICIAL